MLIFTRYMYCTYNKQQQQKVRGKYGIYVIAYWFPLFVIKVFVTCDSSCEPIITCEMLGKMFVKFNIHFNSSILLEAVRNYFYFVLSFSHRIVFVWGWGGVCYKCPQILAVSNLYW